MAIRLDQFFAILKLTQNFLYTKTCMPQFSCECFNMANYDYVINYKEFEILNEQISNGMSNCAIE